MQLQEYSEKIKNSVDSIEDKFIEVQEKLDEIIKAVEDLNMFKEMKDEMETADKFKFIFRRKLEKLLDEKRISKDLEFYEKYHTFKLHDVQEAKVQTILDIINILES